MRSSLLVPLALLGLVAGCGGSSGSAAPATGSNVAVAAGDTSCDVAATSLPTGKHTFAVRNGGKDVTEVYVYAKGSTGAFDKVVGEVDNIAPQTSRTFTATLSAGQYEVACKPGQKGDGIRATLTVSGASAGPSAAAAYDREVAVTAKDYAFAGLTGFTGKVGEKVEFTLENTGQAVHELAVLGPDGQRVGGVDPTDPGQEGEGIVSFDKPGTYTYLCGVGDHATRGMKGSFTVS